MRRSLSAACLALAAAASGPGGGGPARAAEARYTILDWADLSGWADDEHACGDMRDPQWRAPCAFGKGLDVADPAAVRAFFETLFRPVLIEDGAPMLFTGYFEPELRGSRTAQGQYLYPIYATPPELVDGEPFLTRAEIEETGALSNRGLEIAWLADPVDAYFLQIQGSGRVRLDDGTVIRVGYGGKNGWDYQSIGQELVRRGEFEPHQVSAEVIRHWVARHPDEGAALLRHNPSFVFFREVSQVPADRGPLGAMNRSLTPMRSLAVDPSVVPLGAPVWVEKDGTRPIRSLMVAQDTGSAIKGAQRADIFYGTGRRAGQTAGRIRDGGRMIVLMPIEAAYAKVPGV